MARKFTLTKGSGRYTGTIYGTRSEIRRAGVTRGGGWRPRQSAFGNVPRRVMRGSHPFKLNGK